jgi:imidazolonepropionase-like amidohydrolase
MATTRITGARVYDGRGNAAMDDCVVVIDGSKITWVGPSDAAPASESTSEHVIDARGLTLLPGLIDSHVHLCAEPLRPPTYDPMGIGEDQLALHVLSHAQQALRAGITTLVDCGGREYVTLTVRDSINAGVVSGARILTTGLGITITGGHFNWFAIEADDESELRKAARTLIKHGVDHIKLFGTDGGVTMTSNPAMAQYSVQEFRTVIEEAERGGVTVTTHVHGTPGIRNAIAAGIHRLEHCQFFNEEGGISFDTELTEQIVEKGIPISLGMARRWRTTSEIEEHLTPRQLKQRGIREERIGVLRRFREMGVKIVASTDAGMTSTPFDDLPNLMTFLHLEVGMTVPEVIHSATGRAAEAIGVSDTIGTIEPGKAADLLLIDGNPEQTISALTSPRYVIKAGVVIGTNGSNQTHWPAGAA